MAPFASHTIDTTGVSTYFCCFPVKNSQLESLPIIHEALRVTIQSCTVPGTRERKKAEYRHTNPAGHLYGLCLPMAEKNRLRYAVQLIEFLCIVDDVMEDLPFGEACIEHAILRQALYEKYDEDQYAGLAVGSLKTFLRNMRVELEQNDPSSGQLLKALDVSLHTRDSVDIEFQSLEGYIPYRKVNFDYDFVCQLIRWVSAIPFKLAEEEEKILRQYEHSIGVIVGLTNDYFSWEMECQQATDRIRNAVAVLMKEYDSLPDKQAKSILKDIIIDEEDKASRLKADIDANVRFSNDLKKYVLALQLLAAGYSYWCATSPRYHRPQTEEDLVNYS